MTAPLTAENAPAAPGRKRPLAFTLLGVYSLLLAVVTGVPQLYYVLFAINRGAFPIAPDANPLGAVWFNYILGGHQGGYLEVDAGVLAGAIEDAFMMAPLYLATGIGLLRLRRWVYPVGLIAGAMILYAILYFILSGTLAQKTTDATAVVATLLSAVPYLAYPLWLIPTLLTRKALLAPRPAA